MKHIVITVIAMFLLCPFNYAQTISLNKVLELKMPKNTGDDFCGTRGASVCWNPVTKKYYAGFAGNKGFPLAVFDVTGNRVSDEGLTTLTDLRGLWYDPQSKKISGNGYDQNGWFSYILDMNFIPQDFVVDHEGMNQPDANSVATYNPKRKEVLFLNNGQVSFYKPDATSDRSLKLQLGGSKSETNTGDQGAIASTSDYNNTTVIYTGIAGSELGVLNVAERQIELYNYTTGSWSKSFSLPDDAPVEGLFNFAYANGIYWLFDIVGRRWLGYN